MIKVAGIFLIRKDLKVLICHPTKHKDDIWSIPKGRVEEGEELTEAAIRETFEETNIDLSNWIHMLTLEPVPYPKSKSNKVLFGYALLESQNRISFNLFDLKCNSNVPLDIGGFPEMDGYQWVTFEKAGSLLHAAQVIALEQIKEYIEDLNLK
jgi:8-oxo-dGTP pyrophosphatase MutT (NUDIX family)